MLYGIMAALVITATMTLVAATIYCLNTWRDSIECAKGVCGIRDYIRIRFKEFIHFYAVVPDNFELSRKYCRCSFTGDYGRKEYYITFSFLDYIRYRIWYKSLVTTDKRKREMSIKTDFCKDMRKAIFETNKDIEEEIKDCARQFKDITKRNF